MRYLGQSHEINVPLTDDIIGDFHRLHQRLYGRMNTNQPTEIVTLRVRTIGENLTDKLAKPKPLNPKNGSPKVGRRKLLIDRSLCEFDIYARELLQPGFKVKGPALIVEFSSTTYVPPDFNLETDQNFNLILKQD